MRKQHKTGLVMFLVLAFGIVFMMNSHEVVGASKQTLSAEKVKKAPAGLNDPAWKEAKVADVHFEGKESFAGKNALVGTKALYTDQEIYFLFSWKDANSVSTAGPKNISAWASRLTSNSTSSSSPPSSRPNQRDKDSTAGTVESTTDWIASTGGSSLIRPRSARRRSLRSTLLVRRKICRAAFRAKELYL